MTETDFEKMQLQLARLQALQDCRNLMGRYSYYHTAFRNIDYVNECWAKRSDSCLEMPWGIYDGWESICRCYLEEHGDWSVIPDSERKGEVFMHEMDTEVLVVADDGETARGCWISPGHETFKDDRGMLVANWSWGKYAADFINENGVWKIWHMRLYPLYLCPYEGGWAVAAERDDIFNDGIKGADRAPSKDLWRYNKDAVYPYNQPEPPKPYHTYSDVGLTFIDPKES